MKQNIIIAAIAVLLYLLNQCYIKPTTGHIFFHGYFNNVLAPLLLLSYVNILLALYDYKGIRLTNFYLVSLFMLVVGIYWQYVAPLYKSSIVSDPLDILANLFGGMIYCLIIRWLR